MCLLLRMGNCTCLKFTPNPESSSANLTNSNGSNDSQSYDIKPESPSQPNLTTISNSRPKTTIKIKPTDIKITDTNPPNNSTKDIFPINEETQQHKNINNNINNSNNNNNNNRLRPQPQSYIKTNNNIVNHMSVNSFQQIEHSESITNMTPSVNTAITTPSNLNTITTTTTTPIDLNGYDNYYTQTRSRQTSLNGLDENETIDSTESYKNTYNNEFIKNLEKQQNQTSLNSFLSKIKSRKIIKRKITDEEPKYHKALSTATDSSTVDVIFIDEIKKTEEEDSNENDSNSDSPGPLPSLNNYNSNRPPICWGNNGHEAQYSELTSRTSRADTIDRLKIPALTPLNKSVSAFDELGKKLNRLPSFHRALTSASITSLTSMHSQSIHLSKSLQLTNGPSLNSIHSLRLANTPTAINNSLIRFDTDSATPITHNNNNNKASMSPSLPSISDKAVINIQHTQSYSKSMTQTYTINNINNININKSIINPSHLVQKRVLFVSLVQLYRAYLNGIPDFILQHSIFAFGVKRHWIFPRTADEINESKNSYIDYFKANWSQDFIDIIKQKDECGHVLWIEPCQNNSQSNVNKIWNKINIQLSQIIDLSVSEDETNKKKLQLEIEYKKLLTEEKIKEEIINNDEMNEYLDDNDGVIRFPSDRTDSLPKNLPTISNQFDTNVTDISSIMGGKSEIKGFTNKLISTSSLDIIPSPKDYNENDNDNDMHLNYPSTALNKHQVSISEQLLTIYNSKEDAFKMGAFDTVYMTDNENENENENENDVSTDSSYNDDDNDNKPQWGVDKKPSAIKVDMTMLERTPNNNNNNKNDKFDYKNVLKQTKSRRSETNINIFSENEPKIKIRVDTISENKNHQNIINKNKYLPYYKSLKLNTEFWMNKYEPIRVTQSEQSKLSLAHSAKLISPKLNISPHHNESINLLQREKIKSLFNIQGKEVIKQLKCIKNASDIKLKPIKELFYQSNPTMIPIEYFDLNFYMEAHIDVEHKYFDLLQYCDRYLVNNINITPSQSNNTNTNTNSSSNNNNKNNSKQKPIPLMSNNNNNNNNKMEILSIEDDKEEDDGFKIIEQTSIHDLNVDDSGMVYMVNYDDDDIDDDGYDDIDIDQLLSPKKSQSNTCHRISNTNTNSRPMLRNDSESDVMLFDD